LLCGLGPQHRVEGLLQQSCHGLLALPEHPPFQNILFQCKMYLGLRFIPFSSWFVTNPRYRKRAPGSFIVPSLHQPYGHNHAILLCPETM
jgi:hypothetical protein